MKNNTFKLFFTHFKGTLLHTFLMKKSELEYNGLNKISSRNYADVLHKPSIYFFDKTSFNLLKANLS